VLNLLALNLERLLTSLTRWRWHSYDDYLRSAVWRSKRARALRRAGEACQVCNARDRLQVHHREYEGRWGEEPDDDLTVLCDDCHQLYHDTRPARRQRRGRRLARGTR
jgi:predicted HNH restriction endonuclease